MTIEQTFDEDGEDLGGIVRRIDNLTLAELRAAMAIQRGNIVRENAHYKALAAKILDGVAEDAFVITEALR